MIDFIVLAMLIGGVLILTVLLVLRSRSAVPSPVAQLRPQSHPSLISWCRKPVFKNALIEDYILTFDDGSVYRGRIGRYRTMDGKLFSYYSEWLVEVETRIQWGLEDEKKEKSQ